MPELSALEPFKEDFSNEIIKNNSYKNLEFKNIQFKNSLLTEVNFINCHFNQCVFENSEFTDVSFDKCSLSSFYLIENQKIEINFNRCFIRMASIEQSPIIKLRLTDSNLNQIQFTNMNTGNISIERSIVTHLRLNTMDKCNLDLTQNQFQFSTLKNIRKLNLILNQNKLTKCMFKNISFETLRDSENSFYKNKLYFCRGVPDHFREEIKTSDGLLEPRWIILFRTWWGKTLTTLFMMIIIFITYQLLVGHHGNFSRYVMKEILFNPQRTDLGKEIKIFFSFHSTHIKFLKYLNEAYSVNSSTTVKTDSLLHILNKIPASHKNHLLPTWLLNECLIYNNSDDGIIKIYQIFLNLTDKSYHQTLRKVIFTFCIKEYYPDALILVTGEWLLNAENGMDCLPIIVTAINTNQYIEIKYRLNEIAKSWIKRYIKRDPQNKDFYEQLLNTTSVWDQNLKDEPVVKKLRMVQIN